MFPRSFEKVSEMFGFEEIRKQRVFVSRHWMFIRRYRKNKDVSYYDKDIKSWFSATSCHADATMKYNFNFVCLFSYSGFNRFSYSPNAFYLPEVSFNCSTKSRPVMSATEFGSIFESSSKSGSLSIEMLQRLVFIWPTSFFSWTFSTSPLSVVSSELWDEMVK